MLTKLKLSLVMKCIHILFCACVFSAILFFINHLKPLVCNGDWCAMGISKGTVAATSVRS